MDTLPFVVCLNFKREVWQVSVVISNDCDDINELVEFELFSELFQSLTVVNRMFVMSTEAAFFVVV